MSKALVEGTARSSAPGWAARHKVHQRLNGYSPPTSVSGEKNDEEPNCGSGIMGSNKAQTHKGGATLAFGSEHNAAQPNNRMNTRTIASINTTTITSTSSHKAHSTTVQQNCISPTQQFCIDFPD